MKSSYTAPKLTVHGNVAEITQVLGKSGRVDFIFFTGSGTDVIGSDNDDHGSIDLTCTGVSKDDIGTCKRK